MQIMPTNSAKSADSGLLFFGSTGTATGKDKNTFLEAMQGAMESVRNGSQISVSAALKADADTGRPVVESPYTRTTTDGVTYTLSEVCFTKQELAELRANLLKEGAPEESLRQFDILAGQPNGATLAQVMASLQGTTSTPSLTEEDAHTIIALLGNIDPTGDLAQDVLAKMRDGNGEAALELIAQGFASMDPGSTIEISVDEALALGRGLGLDDSSLMSLAGNFGGFPALRVTAEQFNNLMAPATNQFVQQRANQEKLDAAVEKTLKPIISKARDRMEKEKAASELQSRRVEQSRILIDRTVQERSRDILEDTLASGTRERTDTEDTPRQSSVMSRTADDKHSVMVGHAGKEKHTSRRPGNDKRKVREDSASRHQHAEAAVERPRAADTPAGRDASVPSSVQEQARAADTAPQSDAMSRAANDGRSVMADHGGREAAPSPHPSAETAAQVRTTTTTDAPAAPAATVLSTAGATRDTQPLTGHDAGNDAGHDTTDDASGRDRKDGANPEWNELLGKVEARATAAAAPQATTAANGSFLYSLLQSGQTLPEAVPTQDAAPLPQLSRHVAQQVEQGMLSALRDGGTRLDLQLHPQELGAITITLVARNGEVSAQIRSEKSETAEMVSRQLDTIRINLEQQGIRVDKIEVQLENSADQNGSTAWQDLGQHNARQEEDARREELARLKNLATIRNTSRSSEPSVLEQPMHISGQTARYAGQAMHIVA